MVLKFLDTHAHLTGEGCVCQTDQLVARAQEAGLSHIVNICTDAASLEAGLALSARCAAVSQVGATTPHDVEKEGEAYFELFASAAREGKLVAVGETGLDYHYDHSPREAQRYFFLRYMELALSCQLPLVIHCRDAFVDLIELLDDHYLVDPRAVPGILHCFTGSWQEAQQLLDRGWYLSFSGIVTYKKSLELQEVARRMPLERILLETDTPFLAPQTRRGQPNEPAFLVETAEKVASLRSMAIEELAKACWDNSLRAFPMIQVAR